jgi:hypothetical protein
MDWLNSMAVYGQYPPVNEQVEDEEADLGDEDFYEADQTANGLNSMAAAPNNAPAVHPITGTTNVGI